MLTRKRQQFVEAVAQGKAPRDAYREAYPGRAVTDRTADRRAQELMEDPQVREKLAQLQERAERQAQQQGQQISAQRVLQELANIAFADMTELIEVREQPDGTGRMQMAVIPTERLTPQVRSSVASIRQTTSGLELKQYDKLRALELLGKYLKLFSDRTETEVQGQIEVVLGEAAGYAE